MRWLTNRYVLPLACPGLSVSDPLHVLFEVVDSERVVREPIYRQSLAIEHLSGGRARADGVAGCIVGRWLVSSARRAVDD